MRPHKPNEKISGLKLKMKTKILNLLEINDII